MLLPCSFFLKTAVISAILGGVSVMVWNVTPIKWILEYGEVCDERYDKKSLAYKEYMPLFFALFFLYNLLHFSLSKSTQIPLVQLFVLFCLIQLSISDIKFRILQDQWILMLAALGFLLPCEFLQRLSGMILPVFFYAFWMLICSAFSKACPIGMGDAKLFSGLGFCFGTMGLCVISGSAFIVAGIWAFALLLLKIATKKDRIAFGPFIAIGCVYYMLC